MNVKEVASPALGALDDYESEELVKGTDSLGPRVKIDKRLILWSGLPYCVNE